LCHHAESNPCAGYRDPKKVQLGKDRIYWREFLVPGLVNLKSILYCFASKRA
jgi:hypothetical protein